ncbi:hypothetical protein [Actinophytocola glycyrrhizae]|uniref:PPE family protein n=1 Tax=Actinophytocola glycyrrhizae TaxID=2044873 RepID=A0ABV9S040_9PSEU
MSEYGFFVTAGDIHRWLTEGPGADSLDLAQDATRHEMERENQRADQIVSLSNSIQAGWQGEAGGRAYSAASPLAEHALKGADQLRMSQDLLSRQSGSFTDAANRVEPVPENPPENPLDDAFPFDNDIDKETRDYQSAAQNNFAVFREYDGASSYNETNMPSEYGTTNRPTGTVTVTPPADTIEVGDASGPRNGGGPDDATGPRDHGDPGGHGAGPGGFPGTGAPGTGHPGTVPAGGGQTTPNDHRPTPQPPYSYPPSYPPVNRPSPVPADPGGYAGGVPYGGHQGGTGLRGGGGPGGGAGGGARGFGPAPAPGPGAAAGAPAAEEAAARRAAQAAGARPGAAGPLGAPMGAGRTKDDEDTEHERKILIETDAEATFGSDELTAPQVIGDDEYED